MLYDGQLEPHGFSFFIAVKISTTKENMSNMYNPYGDGKACNRILRALNDEQVDRYEIE